MTEHITKLSLLEEKHYETIEHYFPNFRKEDIMDLHVKDGLILFTHKGSHYNCYHRFHAESVEKVSNFTLSAVNYPTEFVKWFFDHFSGMFENNTQELSNVHTDFIQRTLDILREYYYDLDFSQVMDVKISNGHIIFRYVWGIHMCPAKHMFEYTFWTNLRGEVKSLSKIMKEYFPEIKISEVYDLSIEENMILFTLWWEKYFCPLESREELEKKAQEARLHEEKLHEIENSVRHAVLRVVK